MTLLRYVFITLFSLFSLCSCKIDGEEEVTLHSDGSGSLRLCYVLPYRAISKEDSQDLINFCTGLCARHASLTLREGEYLEAGAGFQKINLCIDFQSADELAEIYKTEKELLRTTNDDASAEDSRLALIVETMLGKLDLSPNWQGLVFQRNVDLSPLFAGKVRDPRIMGNAEFRYILNLPYTSGENNASEVKNGGKTLLWKIPLQQHVNAGFAMHAGLHIAWIQWCWLGAGVLAILCVWLVFKRLIRRRHHSPNEAR